MIRLDKYLADMGKGTRTEVKNLIRKGRIKINDEIVKKPEAKVDPETDLVLLDEVPVAYVSLEYYMLYKPQGTVSATEDRHYPVVTDLITDKSRKDLFPVGRLDLDTEGLLLITNDGDLAHRLLSPGRKVDKTYYARCEGKVAEEWIERFAEGIELSDGLSCRPSDLKILGTHMEDEKEITEILLTIHEGKFHQVKRMMEETGCPVVFLKRLTMGPLSLDEDLKPGDYRKITEEELEKLNNL